MTIGERIRDIRQARGFTQVEFADKINVSKQTLYKYENGIITNIPSDKIEAIAKVADVSPSYLMGWDYDFQDAPSESSASPDYVERFEKYFGKSDLRKRLKGTIIPVYGRVAAGIPIEMIEDIIDTEEIPEEMAKSGEYFGLQIHGDSMSPDICDGDVVIVRKQEDADTGETVIATVNGTDATCKRLKKYHDGLELVSTNPNYEPMFFDNVEIVEKPVCIIGKVVELRRKIK